MIASAARQCRHCLTLVLCLVPAGLMLSLSACGGGDSGSASPAAIAAAADTLASNSDIKVAATAAGVSPFISTVQFTGTYLANLAQVEFTIAAKPNTVSKPVDVRYSSAALVNRGYLVLGSSTHSLNMPVYGLYAGYANQVTLRVTFKDGSVQTFPLTISTAAYDDPSGVYSKVVINKARAAGSSLGFDFFAMKSGLGSPIVVDTDAQIRWVVPATQGSLSTALQSDAFVIGNGYAPSIDVLMLDGTRTTSQIMSTDYTDFHHNLDHGKVALLGEFDATIDGVKNVESNVAELDDTGFIYTSWNLGTIISAYMSAHGDDPTKFVRPGTDWFHSNAVTYDPRDDSIVVSSRENFLIKLDYATGDIIWIFGDPTKYWYTFPSLRAKAVILTNNGLYPIGQHAVSITSQGYFMVMNDGDGSANQPAGQSPGITRTFSAVSMFSIDTASLTATDVYDFEYGQSIFSPVCGSAYEASGQSVLVDYAVADKETAARLVGLDAAHNVVFDFQYPTVPCETSWNAIPMPFDDLVVSE